MLLDTFLKAPEDFIFTKARRQVLDLLDEDEMCNVWGLRASQWALCSS